MPISETRRKVRPSVLVADGEDGVREMFVEYLSHSGFNGVGTALAAEAIAALTTGSASAVVLDLELAGLDLVEVARLAALGVTPLVLTCRTFERLHHPFVAVECVLKPCLPSTLVAAVMRVLTRVARAGAR